MVHYSTNLMVLGSLFITHMMVNSIWYVMILWTGYLLLQILVVFSMGFNLSPRGTVNLSTKIQVGFWKRTFCLSNLILRCCIVGNISCKILTIDSPLLVMVFDRGWFFESMPLQASLVNL